MFPGWSLTTEQIQDIKNNGRPQTLVLSGFTGKNHMFVQPLRGRNSGNKRGSTDEAGGPVSLSMAAGRVAHKADKGLSSRSLASSTTTAFAPPWIKYHGIVLSFQAQSVQRSTMATRPMPGIMGGTAVTKARQAPSPGSSGSHDHDHIGRFQILYHVCDGTYEVKKGGKVFLKRLIGNSISGIETRYPMPDPYAIEIGDEVSIAGHLFRVVDADYFTRKHIMEVRNGVGLGAGLGAEDNEDTLGQMTTTTTIKTAHENKITTYLSRGEDLKLVFRGPVPRTWRGVVLHAWAVEAREHLERFVISFHLEDASVEVRVVDERNEHKSSLLLSRTTLVDPLAAVMGGLAANATSATTSRTTALQRAFEPTDFLVGSCIKICGRDMLVYKLSRASALWLAENIEGIDTVRLQEIDINQSSAKNLETDIEEQDELPPPPMGLDTMQLLAIGPDDRRFVVSVHCADSTISIREYAREKGCVKTQGSKFLQRGHNKVNVADWGEIGATVAVNKHAFQLIDADRSTLEFIAVNPQYFLAAHANEALVGRVQAALCGDLAATVDELTAVDGLQGVPKAKLISACVLLTMKSCRGR